MLHNPIPSSFLWFSTFSTNFITDRRPGNIAMAKDKSAKPEKAIKSSKDTEVKSLSPVKHGAVTKPSQTPKSKSKEMAKQVAVKADKADKKSKKAKKEPTPVSSDESDSEDVEEDSASSSGSEDELPVPKQGGKVNGNAKAAANDDSDSSESSASSDDEAPKSKSASAAATAGAKDDSDAGSEETSEGTSEESSDDEDVEGESKANGAVDAKALNGKLAAVAPKEV